VFAHPLGLTPDLGFDGCCAHFAPLVAACIF
jgi:hypothetical protein